MVVTNYKFDSTQNLIVFEQWNVKVILSIQSGIRTNFRSENLALITLSYQDNAKVINVIICRIVPYVIKKV
jgi:hypothetical protein